MAFTRPAPAPAAPARGPLVPSVACNRGPKTAATAASGSAVVVHAVRKEADMVRKVGADGLAWHEPPYTKDEWMQMAKSIAPPVTVGSSRPRTVPPPAEVPP